MRKLTEHQRLKAIAEIIEAVDNRCLTVDGPVARFQDEVTDRELKEIYRLAKGRKATTGDK